MSEGLLIFVLCLLRMISCQEKALENLKLGLYDVLPTSCLEGLTAEDFRLLVNGVSVHYLHTLASAAFGKTDHGVGIKRCIYLPNYVPKRDILWLSSFLSAANSQGIT